MFKKEIYEEEDFKTHCQPAYDHTVSEANKKGIDLDEYYFSQYVINPLKSKEMLGMVTYLLDNGEEDTSFYVEILFNADGNIVKTMSEIDQD